MSIQRWQTFGCSFDRNLRNRSRNGETAVESARTAGEPAELTTARRMLSHTTTMSAKAANLRQLCAASALSLNWFTRSAIYTRVTN